ncbi:MAG TPA: flagellar motor switch protein FliN [Gemmatimonadales bacterium]|jgi:flagellar motor switch protein FliN/FliY|nr:flagellar motor switch protein FliN [Gemmatimonadales bacterium]
MDQKDIDRLAGGAKGAAAESATRAPDLSELKPHAGGRPAGPTGAGGAPLGTLLDVSLPVAIEFGRTHMTVQEVLELGSGSVIQLDRMVGEPIDIYVSDRKLAEGEVVVIGEHFGVRITRITPGNEHPATHREPV